LGARGALLFARYAYPPNELGYCGPQGSRALLERDATLEIERRARQFEGAWSYLEFIADSAGIPDPLDARVVEAYWVGNDLLSRCDPGALSRHLGVRFFGQQGGTWQSAAERAQAHHSFQVFEVYPWARMLASDGNPIALSVLDRCRIRVGVVMAVQGEKATVQSAPLRWDGSRLEAGSTSLEVVRWSTDGRSLLDGLSPGDRVSLHWDWVCDVVTPEQARSIQSREARQLAVLGGPRTPTSPQNRTEMA
jgi:Family of unknown function (DUF6390)